MDPKFGAKLNDLERRVLDQAGTLDPAIRRAAAAGDAVPDDLTAYVEKVRLHAFEVTDQDVRGLLGAGYSEDQIFELTVATAYGAARARLDSGLDAMAGRSAPVSTPGETDR
jgi:alkylhydroperoxidase family enzyme